MPREPIYGEIPAGPQNLVWRAVELMRSAAKSAWQSARREIQLVKRIPAAAGLGGGSSDAAAALVAANIGWNLHWPRERLQELAAELGSDVPFFLTRGCGGLPRARREDDEVPRSPSAHGGCSSTRRNRHARRSISACRPADRTERRSRLFSRPSQRETLPTLGKLLVNRLQPAAAAVTPWIQQLQRLFRERKCLGTPDERQRVELFRPLPFGTQRSPADIAGCGPASRSGLCCDDGSNDNGSRELAAFGRIPLRRATWRETPWKSPRSASS